MLFFKNEATLVPARKGEISSGSAMSNMIPLAVFLIEQTRHVFSTPFSLNRMS